MTIIIKRERPGRRGLSSGWLIAGFAVLGGVGLGALVWSRGGPQPLREFSTPIPVPAPAGPAR